ncbi:hypothetical protein HK104_008057, partial [Borealophlyctis nickersoniae]
MADIDYTEAFFSVCMRLPPETMITGGMPLEPAPRQSIMTKIMADAGSTLEFIADILTDPRCTISENAHWTRLVVAYLWRGIVKCFESWKDGLAAE